MATLEVIELRRVTMPLVAPFRTSFGTQRDRDILLVRVETDAAEGWGECVAIREPVYSAEYTDGAHDVLRRFIAPLLLGADVDAAGIAGRLKAIHGHQMAKGAVEMAVLDAELRAAGRSFADAMGATADRVPAGVSVGLHATDEELLHTVDGYLAEGYRRIKLKIEPGRDVEMVAAVRAAFGDVPLQVDANAAYRLADTDRLRQLDEFGLLLIEQPLPEDELVAHATLAGKLETAICLDESITSAARCVEALDLGAASVINIKAGRVGGYLTARAIADLCAERNVPVWCGGMVETGLGRAANAALAAHPNMRLPGDVSAASRFYERDLVTVPAVLDDGHVRVPDGPGLGVEIDHAVLDACTTSVEQLTR